LQGTGCKFKSGATGMVAPLLVWELKTESAAYFL